MALVSLIVLLIIRNFLSRIKYSQIAIFSEGNQYSNTFLPIVKELIKRKVYFNYYTLDNSDELLTIKSEKKQDDIYLIKTSASLNKKSVFLFL